MLNSEQVRTVDCVVYAFSTRRLFLLFDFRGAAATVVVRHKVCRLILHRILSFTIQDVLVTRVMVTGRYLNVVVVASESSSTTSTFFRDRRPIQNLPILTRCQTAKRAYTPFSDILYYAGLLSREIDNAIENRANS